MKSQKVRLLLAVGGLVVLGSSLIIEAVSVRVETNLANAVQHISKVFFRQRSGGIGEKVTIEGIDSFVKIVTNENFILNHNELSHPNKILYGLISAGNTILGGENNIIDGDSKNSVIIAGRSNLISDSTGAMIGGGISNTIENGDYSVIAGGNSNYIDGKYSNIPGGKSNDIFGDYSVALGINNKIGDEDKADYSVALGSGSKILGHKSFLWSDGNQISELYGDDTFAVISSNGMVVNDTKPHNLAKLTIGSGSLVISTGADISSCDDTSKGVLKTVQSGSSVCLCSCDGNSWSSLYGEGLCNSVCGVDSDVVPVCGDLTRVCLGTIGNYYSGSCLTGKAIDGTGAYFIDGTGNVHWSCQTENGNVTGCVALQSTISTVGACLGDGEYMCDFSSVNNNSLVTGTFIPSTGDILQVTLYASESEASGKPCAGWCITGYAPKFNEENNIRECKPAPCGAQEYSGYYFPAADNGHSSTGEITGYINDGTFICQGTARCELGSFTGLTQSCDYTCGTGSNEYSGYHYEAPFHDGLTLTGSKSTTVTTGNGTLSSPKLTKTTVCERGLYCLSGTIELLDNEICGDNGCAEMVYISSPRGNEYFLPAAYRGYGQSALPASVRSSTDPMCSLKYSCREASFTVSGFNFTGSEFTGFNEICMGTGNSYVTTGSYVAGAQCLGNPTEGRENRIIKSEGNKTGFVYWSFKEWESFDTSLSCKWTCDWSKYLVPVYDSTNTVISCECQYPKEWDDGDGRCNDKNNGCDEQNWKCVGDDEPVEDLEGSNQYVYAWFCGENWCARCRDGSNYDDNAGEYGGCNVGCHKCAKNGFPYCFPIDFSSTCTE